MLFLVEMRVRIPAEADPEHIARLKAAEKDRARQLQRTGQWLHLWRVVGRYANVSVFDADSHEALHEMLCTLPMWPYLDIVVVPLARHPSAIDRGNEFRRRHNGRLPVKEVTMMSQERTAQVVGDLFTAVRDVLLKHEISYAEYTAAKDYLISLGDAQEWPLFADVFFESTVERVAAEHNTGSQSTIEGPYYVPGAPHLDRPYVLPQRADEPGDVLLFNASVRTPDGSPIPGAVLDIWQADATGEYSHINPTLPDYNLRGKVATDDNGEIELRTVVPAPYEIPKGGPVGKLLNAAGWYAWRPAHLHFIITADGYEPLTTQLFFADDQWLNADCAGAVKPELVLHLTKHANAGEQPHFSTSYQFQLGPVA